MGVLTQRLIKFPSIDQFRNTVYDVNQHAQYVGKDEAGEPIYDPTLPRPTISFHGTVKLHGTCAGVSFHPELGIWACSKERIITPEQDNAGFAQFVKWNENTFARLALDAAARHELNMNDSIFTIYGEWAGQGIQKGVAISQLPKAFYIFGLKVSPLSVEGDDAAKWYEHSLLEDKAARIFNVKHFPTYKIDIDFNNPQLSQNRLGEITLGVEAECPIARELGVSGIGEGVVWTGFHNERRYCFKVKGEKHSVSKVKTLASVDTEKLNSIKEFVESVVTPQRVEQAISIVCQGNPDIKKLGDVIRWVHNDIVKEELDTMSANGIEVKDIGSQVAAAAKQIFFQKMKEFTHVG